METTMQRTLSSLARSGLVALGLVAGLPFAVSAGPISLGSMPLANAQPTDLTPIPVQSRCGSLPGCRDSWSRENWRQDGWRRDDWRRNDWRRDGWRDDWRWRHRPQHRRNFSGTGIYLNFGIPAYRYYEPRYYQPRYVQPRRIYRGEASSAHVRWCYNRYRSYRAWDNTFQPYNGPRQQCWSPYR